MSLKKSSNVLEVKIHQKKGRGNVAFHPEKKCGIFSISLHDTQAFSERGSETEITLIFMKIFICL